jgi:hypothetical protein
MFAWTFIKYIILGWANSPVKAASVATNARVRPALPASNNDTESGANISLSHPGTRETDTRTATQREAASAGWAATTPTVRATAEEAAPAATEVGGSAVEEMAGKTRAELAANTPIRPSAGKAAAVARAALVATSAMGSLAAAAPTAGV